MLHNMLDGMLASFDQRFYPFSELNSDPMLSYVPDLFQIFLRSLVPARNTINDIHYAGIGQSITPDGSTSINFMSIASCSWSRSSS